MEFNRQWFETCRDILDKDGYELNYNAQVGMWRVRDWGDSVTTYKELREITHIDY